MGALTGQSIASSYEQLLHVDRDGGGNTTTLVDVKDGDNGTTFALKLAQYHAEIRGTVGTGATGAGKLNLSTSELTVVDNDVLGRIDFLAPLESSGTDAILAGASIWGEAEDTFAADNNSTGIVFATNTSAAAAEKMRLDSSGNLGIGTDSPSHMLVAKGAAGTSPVIEMINSDTEDTDTGRETSIRFSGFRSGGEAVINAQLSGHHDGSGDDDKGLMLLYTNSGSGSTERLRIDSDGDVTVQTGDLIMGTSGKGISFAATSDAGGMTSEVLDDYEEGTFTPTFVSSGATFGYGGATGGLYTKIGNIVYYSLWVGGDYSTDASGGTAGNTLKFGGFPFTSHSTSIYGGGTVQGMRSIDLSPATYSNFSVSVDANSTEATFSCVIADGSYGTNLYTITYGDIHSSFKYGWVRLIGHYHID